MGQLARWSGQAPEAWEWGYPGGALVQLRRRLGLSQRDVAARAGISQGHVQRIEAGGDFRCSTLARLLAALGLAPMLAVDFSTRTPGKALK